MKLVNFRRLKIGRRSRLHERKRSFKLRLFNHQLNKDKFYLKQDLKLATKLLLSTTGCVQRYKTIQDDRETIRLQAALLN
jgi:hypothetical protein